MLFVFGKKINTFSSLTVSQSINSRVNICREHLLEQNHSQNIYQSIVTGRKINPFSSQFHKVLIVEQKHPQSIYQSRNNTEYLLEQKHPQSFFQSIRTGRQINPFSSLPVSQCINCRVEIYIKYYLKYKYTQTIY